MSSVLKVSSNPHIRSKDTTAHIMQYVVIALLPATAFGVYNFGLHALLVILTTVAATVLTEYLYDKCMKKKNSISDFSAVVTGLLLALNLPPQAPLWLGIIGGIFAIIVVKMLFGGLGQNMVIGRISGTIGETSMIALLIGAVFLLVMGVIDLRIPGSYIISFALFVLLFSGHGFDMEYLVSQLAGGGLMLGAFFMATDYVTRPITKTGQYIFGIFLGVMTGIFRLFGPSAEGVSYAIILGNLLVPLIERVTKPKPFGKGGERA